MQLKKNKKAFTLVELLVVTTILGILATFGIVQFRGSQQRATDTRRQSDLRQYQNALEIYATKNNSVYPVQSSAGPAADICSSLATPSCPSDTKTGVAGHIDYQYVSDTSGLEYVLWAQFERTDDYFILCSNGQVGISDTAPTSSTCPPL